MSFSKWVKSTLLGGVTAVAAFIPGACSQQETIATLVGTLGHAIGTLVALQGNTDLGAKLQNDTNLAVTAIKAWKPGTSAGDAIRLLNQVISDIQTLKLPEKYKPFVTLALGTAASIMDILHGTPSTDVRITVPPKNAKEFDLLWDSIRASTPQADEVPVL